MRIDLMNRLMGALYMAPEGGGDATAAAGGGGAGGAGGSGGVDAGGAGASKAGGDAAGAGDKGAAGGDAGAGGEGGGSLLAAGKQAAGGDKGGEGGKQLTDEEKKAAASLEASEKDARRPKHVPAKYWDAEKGSVRDEAAFKSLTELEGRMRAVGLPPKEAGEYKFDVPEVLKKAGVDLDQASAKSFRDTAHALGLTQKQYEGVMGAYFQNLQGLANQAGSFSQAQARTELMGHYKTEEAMNAALRSAYNAFAAFADPDDLEKIDSIGNIPAVIRVLAKVGKEVGEDPGVHPDAILQGESLEHLMRGAPGKDDSPYWNKDDARHKQTVEKVTRYHEAQSAARRRKAA